MQDKHTPLPTNESRPQEREPASSDAPLYEHNGPPPINQRPTLDAQHSLYGIRGWLLFFTIVSAVAASIQVVVFLLSLTRGELLNAISSALFIVFSATSFTLILQRKKIGAYFYIASTTFSMSFGVVEQALDPHQPAGELLGSTIASICVVLGVGLYFVKSQRVRVTLTR